MAKKAKKKPLPKKRVKAKKTSKRANRSKGPAAKIDKLEQPETNLEPPGEALQDILRRDLAAVPKDSKSLSKERTRAPLRYRLYRMETMTGAKQIEMALNHPDIEVIEAKEVTYSGVSYMRIFYRDGLSTFDEFATMSSEEVCKLLGQREVFVADKNGITLHEEPVETQPTGSGEDDVG